MERIGIEPMTSWLQSRFAGFTTNYEQFTNTLSHCVLRGFGIAVNFHESLFGGYLVGI